MDPGKRSIELEAVSNLLKEEKRSLLARVEVLKQVRKLEGQLINREQMWSKAEHKCRDLESENEALRKSLEDKDARFATFVTEYERIVQEQMKQEEGFKASRERTSQTMSKALHRMIHLKRVNTEKEAEVIHLKEEISKHKEQISDEKMARIANEKKITELVQRIKVLEEENFALKAEKMTVKEEGDKKILELGHKFDVLDKEKQRLEEELMQRIDVVKVLVQEKECMDAKLQQLKTVINGWTVSVKLEDNADLPHNNLCIAGNPSQSQGEQPAKRARPST